MRQDQRRLPGGAPTTARAVDVAAADPLSREWDAASYNRVAGPQTAWGQRVLDTLAVRGDERTVDAGCGTGRADRRSCWPVCRAAG